MFDHIEPARRHALTPRYHRAYDYNVDTQQWLTLIFGILSGILAMVVMFQTRLGKMHTDLKSDMKAMEGRLGKGIDDVKTELKEDIQAVETRLNGRIDEVKAELKENIHTVKTDLKGDIQAVKIDLKQDIHHAEARLNVRIDRIEIGPNPDERTDAQAV